MPAVLSHELVQSLIGAGESRLIEFKVQWYPVNTAEGKAKLAKDILALANSTGPSEEAYLIFGVEDPSRGSTLVGVTEQPSPEAIAQVLADYTTPPPTITTRHIEISGRTISIICVENGAARPYHATRQFPGVLEPSLVYIRRDRTNGTATSLEIQQMLLERIGRSTAFFDAEPLQAGFVGRGHTDSNQTLVARVTNVVDKAVAGIDVMIDLEHVSMPSIMARQRLLTNAILQPRETREVELSLRQPMFFYRYFDAGNPGRLNVTGITNFGEHLGDRWLTARLRVYYRDDEGFLKELIRELAIDG